MRQNNYTISQLIQTDNDELLLAKVLDSTREKILAYPEKAVSKKDFLVFKDLKAKMLKGFPLAYLLGYRWFFGSKFIVSPSVLIPRPETEQLVEKAVEAIKKAKSQAVIDIGTGSGAIIASIAKSVGTAELNFFATDLSVKALATAKRNTANILGQKPAKKIVFKKGDLLEPFLKASKLRQNILIAANLPYLSKAEMKEPSIKFEPAGALLGGHKGSELIKELIRQISENNIRSSIVLLEIGHSQGKELLAFIKKTLPHSRAKVYKDLSKLDRIIEVKIN